MKEPEIQKCRGCNNLPVWIEAKLDPSSHFKGLKVENFDEIVSLRLQCQSLGCRYYGVFTNADSKRKCVINQWNSIVIYGQQDA